MTFLANGCSGSSSAGKTVSGWFGGGSEAAGKGAQVYYAAVEGLDVRAYADASSKVVGNLRLREKVTRTKEKNGYSFVRARGGSIEGWVPSARLDWRAPRATGPAAATTPAADDSAGSSDAPIVGGESTDATAEPAASEITPAGDETTDAAEPAATAPSPPPSPEPASKKKGIGASVFDPY